MSLKAKLEAVIYAAEEPVTLNQLAVLFSDEALEWRAEQEQAAAEAAASARANMSEPLPMIARTFAYLEPEQPAAPAEETADSSVESAANAVAAPQSEVEPEQAESTDESTEESADATPDPTDEEAAKQVARQRDREIRLILRELLDELVADYANDSCGIEIREIAGGFRMATKPEYHDAVRSFIKSLKPAMKLSLPALETLAVIAYKQPVTAPEVNEIRGVDSSGVFGSLLARKLISTAGRKQVVGRPILYKTTKEFLMRFGLKELGELPSMEEFEKMAASELEEPEASRTELEADTTQHAEQESQPENAQEAGAAESATRPDVVEATPEGAIEEAPAE
jgi:segregation and condensation protein B